MARCLNALAIVCGMKRTRGISRRGISETGDLDDPDELSPSRMRYDRRPVVGDSNVSP